jgi:hypothetical protein
MKNVAELLREADPLVAEGAWTAVERQRVRYAVLHANPKTSPTSRRAFAYGLVAAVATLVAVVAGPLWPRVGVIAAVRFEIRVAEASPGLELDAATVRTTAERIYVHRQAVLTNADIASAEAAQDASGAFGIVVRFTRDGATKLLQTTGRNVGRRLAILLDGQVVIAPVVRSPIGESAVISGNFTKAEADRISAGLIGR